jgi:hypothetical protein
MRRQQESFPWIIVMGGAVLYWTIALGIGIPSLYRLLGEPGPARRVSATETRCVQAQTIDGTPVVFGDCINVRFLLDSAELHGSRVVDHHRTLPGELSEPVQQPMIDDSDLVPSEASEMPQAEQQGAASEVVEVEVVPAMQPTRFDPVGRTSF